MAVDSNLKFICAIIATVLVIVGYCPYFRDIIRGKTTPHLYTWLIWVITQVTATFGSWYGGGKFGALSLAIGTILVIAIFCLALKYGTKNITKSDTVLLIVALLAIVVWWQMGNRLIAVFMATAIDVIAYIPTIRKSIIKPRSETLSFWAIMAIVNIFIIASNSQYNFLTVTYAATLMIANTTLFMICFFRRRVLKEAGLDPQ
jgi:hypothetical protein